MKLRIETKDHPDGPPKPGHVKVYDVDSGKELAGIRHIRWTASWDEVCTAELEIVLSDVAVEGDGQLVGIDFNGKRYQLTEIE